MAHMQDITPAQRVIERRQEDMMMQPLTPAMGNVIKPETMSIFYLLEKMKETSSNYSENMQKAAEEKAAASRMLQSFMKYLGENQDDYKHLPQAIQNFLNALKNAGGLSVDELNAVVQMQNMADEISSKVDELNKDKAQLDKYKTQLEKLEQDVKGKKAGAGAALAAFKNSWEYKAFEKVGNVLGEGLSWLIKNVFVPIMAAMWEDATGMPMPKDTLDQMKNVDCSHGFEKAVDGVMNLYTSAITSSDIGKEKDLSSKIVDLQIKVTELEDSIKTIFAKATGKIKMDAQDILSNAQAEISSMQALFQGISKENNDSQDYGC
ncbi:MAG: hypothetical protein JXA94_00555 [Parachlamydiales bacterium]|nr:hypothetical protein [Parachlamydiales bacterium]